MHRPFLVSIEESFKWSEAIVIIRGYRTGHNLTETLREEWRSSLRQAGWKGAIYYLWWDASDEAGLQWWQKKEYAHCTGKQYLPDLISDIPDKSVSLIGYSLGAYVVYSAMKVWSKRLKPLNNSVLIGGSVRRTKEWEVAALNLTGRIINIYNTQDPILSSIYKLGQLPHMSAPCGLMPIKKFHPKITNIDVTTSVGLSHSEWRYLRAIRQVVGQQLWFN